MSTQRRREHELSELISDDLGTRGEGVRRGLIEGRKRSFRVDNGIGIIDELGSIKRPAEPLTLFIYSTCV